MHILAPFIGWKRPKYHYIWLADFSIHIWFYFPYTHTHTWWSTHITYPILLWKWKESLMVWYLLNDHFRKLHEGGRDVRLQGWGEGGGGWQQGDRDDNRDNISLSFFLYITSPFSRFHSFFIFFLSMYFWFVLPPCMYQTNMYYVSYITFLHPVITLFISLSLSLSLSYPFIYFLYYKFLHIKCIFVINIITLNITILYM